MIQDDIQNNKLQILGKLAASLAHEIRNPLSAIKLNLEYVKMSDLNYEVTDSINACLEATNRIQNLIESTLDFTRSTQNECFKQSINDVVELAYEIMNARANILNISIKKQLGKNLDSVYFNKNKLLQVVLNLLTNSLEAVNVNGSVIVRTYREDNGNFITLEVEDNGIGISEENKEKIFKDFYTNKNTGTGLGLSVCKNILNEFNAEINFRSESGKGSCFYVRFNVSK